MEFEPEAPLSTEKEVDKGAGDAKRGGLSTAKKKKQSGSGTQHCPLISALTDKNPFIFVLLSLFTLSDR